MAAPVSDRTAAWLTRIALCAAVVSGSGIILLATRGLRWAHLYRQQFTEGLGFMWVGFGFLVATLGAILSGAVLLWAAERTEAPSRRLVYVGVVATLAALVVGAAVFAFYVESLGTRCFGTCG